MVHKCMRSGQAPNALYLGKAQIAALGELIKGMEAAGMIRHDPTIIDKRPKYQGLVVYPLDVPTAMHVGHTKTHEP